MDYCCDDCSFLFRRVGEIHICPSCEGLNLRAATKTERDQLEKLLIKNATKPKEKLLI